MQLCKLALIIAAALATGPIACLAQQSQAVDSPTEGVWQTDGYGLMVEASAGNLTLYEVTQASCLRVFDGPIEGGAVPELGIGLTEQDGDLLLGDASTQIAARRMPTLPQRCVSGGTASSLDPELNFEVFWRTFEEHYPFFAQRNVDWQGRYMTFRARVTPSTTDTELLALMMEAIAPLNDRRITIQHGTAVSSPGTMPAWFESYGDDVIRYMRSHRSEAKGAVSAAGGLLSYQEASDKVGYLQIAQLAGFSTETASEAVAAGASLDALLNRAGNPPALVIDLRYASSGLDSVARAIAGRFADKRRLAYFSQVRAGKAYGPSHEFYVEPSGASQYRGKVIVLTSKLTSSAAEVLVMALSRMPNVTLMGEPTAGSFSTILGRHLPNGWSLALPNEAYFSADGAAYEVTGIAPNVGLPMDGEGFREGHDTVLEKAIRRGEQATGE